MRLNKNILISIITITLLLSALVYNLLYINNKKNEIIQEIEYGEIEEEKIEESDEKNIYVHIDGAVNIPGLYELSEGDRINDLIIAAGGLSENADLTDINLAYILTDALKVNIPTREENANKTVVISNQISSKEVSSLKEYSLGLVNINTATVDQLKTLNGIGDSIAKKIVEYRNINGGFKSIEELKNVSGIGEAKYAKVANNVTI